MSKPFLSTLLLVGATGAALGPSACSLPERAEVGRSTDDLAGVGGDAGPRGTVVIAAVYAGAGQADSTFRRNFVVLFNRTKTDITLADGSLQYADPGGEFGATADKILPLSGTVKAGSYVLVAVAPVSTGLADVVTAAGDVVADTGGLVLDPAAGKIALVIGTDKPGCGTSVQRCDRNAKVVDYVGWGGVQDFEGAAFQALSNTRGAVRKGNGCTDTNNNGADFDLPDPMTAGKNSATSPAVDCNPPPPPRDSGGPVPPVLDPELGEETPFDGGRRRDAGTSGNAAGASSSSCAATASGLPSPLPVLGIALSALLFASRRRRR